MSSQARTVSLTAERSEAGRTTDKNNPLRCPNSLSLTCTHHGEERRVPCGRWRRCPVCAKRLQWKLRNRFLAGIEQVPDGMHAMFFTLTFPASQAPNETEAQKSWRSLVRRLRYRDLLGEYGFVLQRTKQGVLHFHGIAQMPWMDDELAEWRRLLLASGFGVQNKFLLAKPSHARYITCYISSRLAELAPLRRAYGFSQKFPQPQIVRERQQTDKLLNELHAEPECRWELSGFVAGKLR